MAKAWGRKIELEKQFLIFISERHLDSFRQIKKISYIHFNQAKQRFQTEGGGVGEKKQL